MSSTSDHLRVVKTPYIHLSKLMKTLSQGTWNETVECELDFLYNVQEIISSRIEKLESEGDIDTLHTDYNDKKDFKLMRAHSFGY